MKTFEELARKRGYGCECGCGKAAHERHHCLIPQLKKGGDILDDERNLVLVNSFQHTQQKLFDNHYWRNRFWILQCKRFGEKAMLDWVDEVKRTTKLHKSRFDFMISPKEFSGEMVYIGLNKGKLEITERN